MTLGDQLKQASDAIVDLIIATHDLARKKVLREQLSEILAITAALVDANVAQDTQAYLAATAGLSQANGAIKEAMADLAQVAETIEKIAAAIDLLQQLASALKP